MPGASEARVLGIHMEGPFFSVAQRGAHAAELLRMPNEEEKERLYSYVGPLVRLSIAARARRGAGDHRQAQPGRGAACVAGTRTPRTSRCAWP